MQLVFVHGWSVTHTDTYGGLPRALAAGAGAYGLDLQVRHVHLGRYVSFHDEVTLDDIARALDRALRDLPGNGGDRIAPFSCVTHSTGGPVVRHWLDRYHGADGLAGAPLRHLVMLAPANHGSALARLGKARVGRLKAWFQGVEPGQRVLDWLCLGSDGQWALNGRWLDYEPGARGFYPFVLTGQGIDRSFYDFLNSYLVEKGSDGVVRVCGASLDHRRLTLVQSPTRLVRRRPPTHALEPKGPVRAAAPTPLGVYADRSHSGTRMGIMRSVGPEDTGDSVVRDVLACLAVDGPDAYARRAGELAAFTAGEQRGSHRYAMVVFQVGDDQGGRIAAGDYDVLLLAGPRYRPHQMPDGFLKDRQMNETTGRLVLYLDADKVGRIPGGRFGIRVTARPERGFSYYRPAEFRSEGLGIDAVIAPNQTTYVDVHLHRFVDENLFRFDPATEGARSFKGIRPSGRSLADGGPGTA